jgi:2-desacetyl-2-hydroxyethyl bacteriochlorophyllide A dehydrogenase
VQHLAIPGASLKAAFLDAPGVFDVRMTPDVEPNAGDALVQVRSVGLCGTDFSIASGRIPVAYPRVLGHEIVGELVDPGSTGLAVGTEVLVDPGLSCGTCRQCREGRTNICTNAGLLGRDADGGLRELLPVPSTHIHPVPRDVDTSAAPMVQVFATCVHGQRLMPILAGETVAVVGLGVTGLLHAQLSKQAGATVIGITRSPKKRALAERLGADVTVPADGNEVAEIRRIVGDVDLVIECAGRVSTLARSIELARVGGRILAYGVIGWGAEGSLPYYDLYFKELAIAWARSALPRDFDAALELVGARRIVLEPLVSARFRLEDTAEAFEAASGPDALKILIDV